MAKWDAKRIAELQAPEGKYGPPGCPQYPGSIKGLVVVTGTQYEPRIWRFKTKKLDPKTGKEIWGRGMGTTAIEIKWMWDGSKWVRT